MPELFGAIIETVILNVPPGPMLLGRSKRSILCISVPPVCLKSTFDSIQIFELVFSIVHFILTLVPGATLGSNGSKPTNSHAEPAL